MLGGQHGEEGKKDGEEKDGEEEDHSP